MPTIEECARCAVPKASLTYTSPSLESDARKVAISSAVALIFLHFSPFEGAFFSHLTPGHPFSCSIPLPSSSTCHRKFSSTMMEPSAGLAHAASTSAPTQLSRNVTGLPISSPSLSATGLRVIDGFGRPSGRPRCDMRITALAPFSRASLIVGMAPTMRCVLVIAPVSS